MTTFLPGWRHPHVWEGTPLVAYKWNPKQCDKDCVTSNQVVYIISCQGLCAHNKWPYLEFQFTATNLVSMAAKSRDLVDKTSGANLQVDGHVEVPTQSAKDLQEPEEEDSSPSHSQSWSPARRLPSSCLNTKYCFGDTSDINRRIGGSSTTLSFLDGPTSRRHAAQGKNWTHQSSGDWPQVGQFFSMGDVQLGRA